MSQRFTERLGQPFVLDYKPGASATLAADYVAKAPADGYTLLFATATLALTAVSFPKLPYDTVRDFTPIAFIGSIPFVLTVHPSLPVRTVSEFVALAKKRPDQLYYSSAGPGSLNHVSGLSFAKQTGIRVTHVPYKGAGPQLIALFTGEAQFSFPNLTAILPHLNAGKRRALGIASGRRAQLAPNLPTLAEGGLKGFEAGTLQHRETSTLPSVDRPQCLSRAHDEALNPSPVPRSRSHLE